MPRPRPPARVRPPSSRGVREHRDFLTNIDTTDLLVVLFLMAMFVLGFIQGTVRRLLGIGSIVFSFLFASNVKEPLGDFSGANWTQFSPEYAEMIGYLTIFVAASIAFAIVIQGPTARRPCSRSTASSTRSSAASSASCRSGLILVFLTSLDSFFLLPIPSTRRRSTSCALWTAINDSSTGDLLHNTVIPRLLALVGLLVRESMRALYAPA